MLKSVGKNQNFLRFYSNMAQGLALKDIISRLESFAPLSYAEKWDNVGLLLEPYNQASVEKILLTNDLTERVMKEAVEKKVNMIVSYHPPIFAPMKRITQSNWKQRIVSMCLGQGIALYSPHTAWDSTLGGVNDWLASALPVKDIQPIQPLEGCGNENVGSGRIFSTKMHLDNVIKAVQNHIGLDVHVAMGVEHSGKSEIKKVALCAGSGATLLRGVKADLYITGEMSHHEVLDANHNNVSVILCNHSNSERGFLKTFQPKLDDMLNGQCEIFVAETDEDPIKTYKK
ncbi:NIF3-like protein 1 [Stomoxys calcitrans]|uniref:NIF3-like protein 1 n=1 Tax=Stomoxys calcitrans TaxID=35570 RepID=UPI0027E32623|nr:NIF3-like protein 1 [Stomoxys calcitrans]